LNRLPSRATPYLAPAAGTIITATPLARASRQRDRLTLPNSADRSVPRVQTPIRGTKKPKYSPQAIIRRRHRCRRLASSVVLIVRRHQLRAAPIVGAVTIRAIVTNKPSTSVAARRPPPAPQSAAQAAGAAHAVCGSISHAHRCPRAPQSERGHRRSPSTKLFDLIAVARNPLPRAGRRHHHHRHAPRARE
jgi:hypothetical protein